MVWIGLGTFWILLIAFTHWVHQNPRHDTETGFVYRGAQVYSKIMHRLRVSGLENVPETENPGSLIVVANHTAGIDPILVQSALKFEVRWMMGRDMAPPKFDWFWKWSGVILVDRDKNDRTSVRTAMRHVDDGGVVGIFPEGGIERPPRNLLPFMAGVGLMVKKTGARVLPVIITDTPVTETAMGSFLQRSRSRIEFKSMIDYTKLNLSADTIAKDLQSRYESWTGWPVRTLGQP